MDSVRRGPRRGAWASSHRILTTRPLHSSIRLNPFGPTRHHRFRFRGSLMPTVKELHVNGSRRALAADAGRTLLSVLRDDLDLTGCKYGCGEGRCGACTVLVDGRATR